MSPRRAGLPFGEPARDPLEARPPQGAGLRLLHQRREMLLADTTQLADDVGRQRVGVFPGKLAKRFVDCRAAIGCRQRHVDGIERVELENVAGVDGVGIAQPVLDRGDRELCRPRLARRPRLRLLDRLDLRGLVDRAGVMKIPVAGCLRAFPALLARDGFQPVEKARSDGRTASDLGRMGEDHVLDGRATERSRARKGRCGAPVGRDRVRDASAGSARDRCAAPAATRFRPARPG